MRLSPFLIADLLSRGVSSCAGSSSTAAPCGQFKCQVEPLLSPNGKVQCGRENVRWSEYAAPEPGAVITAGSEDDVAKIVAFANEMNIPFLVQSGANGWAETFTLDSNGIIIDVSELKAVTFNSDKTEVTFQAGVTNADMIRAAWDHGARVSTSTCNCVSLLGATLGGGLSRTQGVYGLNVDQILSLNLVDAAGNKKTVTAQSDPDLWWALKGAGANFGIVTSGVFKSYPLPQADNTAWTGPLVFEQSQLEKVISAINDIDLEPEMQLDIYFAMSAPGGAPIIMVLPFYLGSEEAGRQKFAPILAIGPVADNTAVLPYNIWNDAGDAFCARGGRKPSYTAGLKTMDPVAWRGVWDEYVSFVEQHPGKAGNSTVLAECYSTEVALRQIGDLQSSYSFRDVKCYAIAIPWYDDPALDDKANEFGRKARSYWTASGGTSCPVAYINFAHGDEPLDHIYGNSLIKLQQLKGTYDPNKRFNQWFPLS